MMQFLKYLFRQPKRADMERAILEFLSDGQEHAVLDIWNYLDERFDADVSLARIYWTMDRMDNDGRLRIFDRPAPERRRSKSKMTAAITAIGRRELEGRL